MIITWAFVATVACVVLAVCWRGERIESDSIYTRYTAMFDKNEKSTHVVRETQANYQAKCKELHNLKVHVSKTILSLAEAAQVK